MFFYTVPQNHCVIIMRFGKPVSVRCLPSSRQRELYDTVEPLEGNPRLRSLYHPRILASIDRAISPDPRARFQSVGAWIEALRI